VTTAEILVGQKVGVEPTAEGPYFEASDSDFPAVYATALACFDDIDQVTGDQPDYGEGGIVFGDKDPERPDGDAAYLRRWAIFWTRGSRRKT
jgi:hypothetical protein